MVTRQYANGGWYECPPLRAPIDVRWCCEHDWRAHRHDSGEMSWIDFDCHRCGAQTESGTWPPTVWKVRRWIAERLTAYGRARRSHRALAR